MSISTTLAVTDTITGTTTMWDRDSQALADALASEYVMTATVDDDGTTVADVLTQIDDGIAAGAPTDDAEALLGVRITLPEDDA